MTVHRGDVVLLNFPQPGSEPKRRPAVVVQSNRNNSRLTNSIFVMITSNTRLATTEPTQVLIDPTTPEGRQTGLLRHSAVKCENVYTLPILSVARRIGHLPPSLMEKVTDALRVSLAVGMFQYEPAPIPVEKFRDRFPDGFTMRDEANALVASAFRNGPLEKLHMGQHSKLLDNPTLSRITQDEMRELMLFACERLADLLRLKHSDPEQYFRRIITYNMDHCKKWER